MCNKISPFLIPNKSNNNNIINNNNISINHPCHKMSIWIFKTFLDWTETCFASRAALSNKKESQIRYQKVKNTAAIDGIYEYAKWRENSEQ